MSDATPYIPLHIHSDYSIIDGLESVEAIVKRAGKLGIPALAITDQFNICGFIKFFTACQKAGIKPLMGADITVRDRAQGERGPFFTLTLLAMDRVGKQNLYDVLSKGWLRLQDKANESESTPWVYLDELFALEQGLIVLNGFRGDLAAFMQNGDEKGLKTRVGEYLQVFGDRFCLEITRTGRRFESEFETQALNLCLEYGIAPVASNDTVFLYGEADTPEDGFSDYQIHDIRVAIQHGVKRGDKEMARRYSKEQYLKSPAEMQELFADLPEALQNTVAIAERCNIDMELDHPRLPHYPTGNLTAAECLRQKAYEGLEERLEFLYPDPKVREEKRPEYVKRLETELNVIITMDFPGYFLIVMEFIQWSKDHGVSVGPGRGSGGGSLVAYALKITDFDPMRFDLLFERFLNPERVSMPDFDVDFCQRNRERTLDHVRERYGLNAVSQIATFGTMAPKAAIKDAGRALGMGYGAVDYVAKMLPTQPGLTFNMALGIGKNGKPCESAAPDFLNLYQKALQDDDKARVELIHVAMRLEGVIRNLGKHAAGVVISPTRTAEFSPLMLDSDRNSITQFDKKDVEHAGLVKFDFLGLTTLTIISDALDMINERLKREHKPPLDIHAVPYEDDASFKVLQQGETTAVFQLESTGMRKLISQMKPDRFDDLIALVALYRPGPIKSGMVDHFVQRKHGREAVAYPSPDFQDLDLKPILDSTYGVIVYQEQVMQIAQVLAGYSLGGADILRRAMGKKNPAEMASQRSVFREGAIEKHKDPDIAMKIFDQVEKFAEYGFNKSHSAAYALVAWWTLYLKTHYPAEFLAAMMTADRQRTEKLVTYIADCRRLGIRVNPPDVTVGKFDFTVNREGEIVYGIGAVKGIGEAFVNHVVKVREKEGGFEDFFDFVAKVGADFINKRTLESLILSGALDRLCPSRARMMASVPDAIKYASQKEADAASGQLDLFSVLDTSVTRPVLSRAREWPEKYQLYLEKGVLGLYLSGHPINAYRGELNRLALTPLSHLRPSGPRPMDAMIAGVVISSTDRISKQDGKRYYVVVIDDSTSQIELMFYGQNAEAYGNLLAERKKRRDLIAKNGDTDSTWVESPLILVVSGAVFLTEDNMLRFRIQRLRALETLRRHDARTLTVKVDSSALKETAREMNRLMERNLIDMEKTPLPYSGNSEDPPVRGCALNLMLDNTLVHFKNNRFRLDPNDDLMDGLRDLFGRDTVRVGY